MERDEEDEREIIDMAHVPIMPAMSLIPSRTLGYEGGRAKQLADLFGGVGPVIPAADQLDDLGLWESKVPAQTPPQDSKIRILSRDSAVSGNPSVHRVNDLKTPQVGVSLYFL